MWILLYTFYFTYKELKQRQYDIWEGSHWTFYFTYKELKPFLGDGAWYKSITFYFTYKELKRWSERKRWECNKLLFTLPIRNWNFIVIYLFILLKETFYFTYKELKQLPFFPKSFNNHLFTLPIRNWNQNAYQRRQKEFIILFTLPIRNWNWEKG